MNRTFAVLTIAAATAAAHAAEPFSVIDTTDWNKVEAYTAPVTIASIDGQDYLSETRRTITPGKHTLEFDFKYDGLGFGTLAFNNLSWAWLDLHFRQL